MLLYVIRHGAPTYDPDELTPLGHRQAEALGHRLSTHGLDKIFVSPMIRARQTAQPTCEMLGIEPGIEEWTSEDLAWRDLSCVDEAGHRGWVFAQQSTRYKTPEIMALGDRWYEAEPFTRCVRAKAGYERIQKASDEFLLRLGYRREGLLYRVVRPSEERVAVFCHQGFGTTWLSHLLSVQPPLFWASFDLGLSSITILQFVNNPDGWTAPRCIALSDTSHLYGERLPLRFNRSVDI